MKKLPLVALAGLMMLGPPALAAKEATKEGAKETVAAAATDQHEDKDRDARTAQAKHFLKLSPPESIITQMLDNLAKNPQANLSAADIKSIEASMDYSELNKTALESLVKNFTLEELKMMSELYESPVGKALIHKMPMYMEDLKPILQQQIKENVIGFIQKRQQQQLPAAPAATAPQP